MGKPINKEFNRQRDIDRGACCASCKVYFISPHGQPVVCEFCKKLYPHKTELNKYKTSWIPEIDGKELYKNLKAMKQTFHYDTEISYSKWWNEKVTEYYNGK